ncbi:hypothetical protein O0I10_012537 [Lichtheimia ornata]|uniref:Phospholipid/glycerol acyltransferase domain-containing protein n=1 Tax=Lichtheimia ornata TaxID=688661 RepID=A0AAD7XVQ0_9FUNG|nr:uncharacterized protein O0I10_012537 [Lichtheimia ornata]KAJ8651892.1 hypothetical protein O0I10_012537 [Lichtheimia ornata]
MNSPNQKWLDIGYDTALWIFNIMLEVFFREIRPRGAHKIPKSGPVIFVAAPHANQFVDPLIVMRECHRRVSFLIAAKSMKQKAIGFLARMIHAIPVVRPQDIASKGHGRVMLLNPKSDPLRITGVDSKFLSQLRPDDSIVLPRNAGKLVVSKVISDTELELKEGVKNNDKALQVLTTAEGSAYKCLPHVDQDAVYEKVYDELNNGECITIFPEGGSHDRAEMLPLKAGVTIMALGAMAKYPGLEVKIVPCGLNYFHAHRFRSRAVIEFGNPITISPELVDKFKKGGAEKREACGNLLDTIYYSLKSVTVNVPNDQTLMVIQAARRLYKPANRRLHIAQIVDLNRRFVIGYNLYKDDPKIIELQRNVLAYNQLLKYHGLQDHQVPDINLRGWRTFFLLLYRVLILFVWGLLAFPGGILNIPILVVAKVISMKKAKEALAASTVKVKGRDVLATWKFLVGLVLIPTLYGLYTLVMFAYTMKQDWTWTWRILVSLATWNLLPFVSYASMRFGENGMDVYKSLRPLYMALIDPDSTQNLRENRERLSQEITQVINDYGPKVFSDFDENNVFRADPSGNRESVSELGEGGKTFSQIASQFFNNKALDWLDDRNIFNLTRQEEEMEQEDVLHFLDKNSGLISGGSASEAESSGTVRRRRRVPGSNLSKLTSTSTSSESIKKEE